MITQRLPDNPYTSAASWFQDFVEFSAYYYAEL